MSPGGDHLDHVLAQIHEQKVTSFVTARSGSQAVDSRTGGRTVVLNQGYRYVGEPGSAQFDVIQFNTLTTHFKPPQFMYSSSKRKIEPTGRLLRSEEHTSELQSLMRISYAVSCLKKKKNK